MGVGRLKADAESETAVPSVKLEVQVTNTVRMMAHDKLYIGIDGVKKKHEGIKRVQTMNPHTNDVVYISVPEERL